MDYTIKSNRFDIYGESWQDADTRKGAFKEAAETYISERIFSGLPTKKPFIVWVTEYKKGEGKTIRQWEIKLTIKQMKGKK